MDIKSTDELYQDVKELSESLNSMSTLPPNWEGRIKIDQWLKTLSQMEASEELNESQVRQMIFDLQTSFDEIGKIMNES